tara:strand:- start:269 stop:394 length:126 start_codon:yes stop_codon:yes gene_type:complete
MITMNEQQQRQVVGGGGGQAPTMASQGQAPDGAATTHMQQQ